MTPRLAQSRMCPSAKNSKVHQPNRRNERTASIELGYVRADKNDPLQAPWTSRSWPPLRADSSTVGMPLPREKIHDATSSQ